MNATIKLGNAFLRQFTHFEDKPSNGTFLCFKMDACEKCGGEVQAANAIRIARGNVAQTRWSLLANGLKPVTELPAEGYYCEETGGECCDNC